MSDWFKERDEMFFVDGVKALEQCQTKCIAVDGDYIDKL